VCTQIYFVIKSARTRPSRQGQIEVNKNIVTLMSSAIILFESFYRTSNKRNDKIPNSMTAKNEKNVRLPDSIMISVYFFNVKFPLFSLSIKKN
jgi:hypothetical protein